MRFEPDHDFHIHTKLSFCSNDPEQSTENILKYGEKNGFKTLCFTDHMWDTARIPTDHHFYKNQTYEYICGSLPLPKSDKVKLFFGCETDLNSDMVLGVSAEVMDKLDFIIIAINHFHMDDFTCTGEETREELAKLFIKRFDAVLDMDLPFHKIGMAHLCGGEITRSRAVPDSEYRRVFAKAADKGIGIEINLRLQSMTGEHRDAVMAPLFIAKEEGCKFYLGSDIHHPHNMPDVLDRFNTAIDILDLREEDKFIIGK